LKLETRLHLGDVELQGHSGSDTVSDADLAVRPGFGPSAAPCIYQVSTSAMATMVLEA